MRASPLSPATTEEETEPTPAMAATPSARQARKMRKPLSPPRSSRAARRSSSGALTPAPRSGPYRRRGAPVVDYAPVGDGDRAVAALGERRVVGDEEQGRAVPRL